MTFINDKKFKLTKYFEFFLKLHNWQLRGIPIEDDLGTEKRKLCKGSLDDCRFIIYTTCRAWKSAVPCKEEGLHKKAFKILRTGEKNSCVLRFNEEDTAILSQHLIDARLIDTNQRPQFQNEFLPRLRVFCGQTVHRGLDMLIQKEAESVFGGLLPDGKYLHLEYLNYLKEWATKTQKNYCLTEKSGEYEWFMAENLRERAKQAARLKLLKFKEIACKALKRTVEDLRNPSEGDALIVEVPGVGPGHRAAKLLCSLDDKSWAYAGLEAVRRFPLRALEAVCKAKHCKIMVLDLKSPSKNVDKLVSAINGSVKIIRLGSDSNEALFRLTPTYQDNWKLEDLEYFAQERFLKTKVDFKGKPVQLRDLEKKWPGLRREVDGKQLEALMLGKAMIVQLSPPAHDNDRPTFYIQSQVQSFNAEYLNEYSSEKYLEEDSSEEDLK